MNERQQRYFARVTAGLEQVAWGDIERRLPARLLGFGHRRIDFGYAEAPGALLGLRCVDDVYVYVARLGGMERARASLARLTQQFAHVDFARALAACAAVRPLPASPSYRVTASHLGKRNYSRYDVEGAVELALAATLPWRFVPNDPEEPDPDLDLRILIEDDWALIGLRLGATPLHRRAYKVASRPGSLKAPVAYCLCLLAGLEPGGVALDLACGAGTILAEAAALMGEGLVVGGDSDARALDLALENLTSAGLEATIADAERVAGLIAAPGRRSEALLYQGDATQTPLADRSVRAVVTNLPWGQQAPVAGEHADFYAEVLREIARLLAPGGRAVLLTDQTETLEAALAACRSLSLADSLQISLFGRHPMIYIVEQANR